MNSKFLFFLTSLIAVSAGTLANTTTVETKADSLSIQEGFHVPKIVDFACGEYHTLAIDSNGNLWQWGCGGKQQTTPMQIMPGIKFKKVSAGNEYSVALDVEGNVYHWYRFETPTIYNGNYESVGYYANKNGYFVADTLKKEFVSYRTSSNSESYSFSSLYLNSAGKLCSKVVDAVWGSTTKNTNYVGELTYSSASAVGESNRQFAFVGTPLESTKSGFVIQWMSNGVSGAPKIDSYPSQYEPCRNLYNVSPIITGRFVDCALLKTSSTSNAAGFAVREDGVVFSFGYNEAGTNLLGSTETQSITGQFNTPVEVSLNQPVKRIEAGRSHVVALGEDGNLYSWGYNSYGQLGLGNKTTQLLPTLISFFASNMQCSFVATKGDAYEGSFALEGMNSYSVAVPPSKGILSLDSDSGDFTYEPDNAATGDDYFEIEVSDGINSKTYIVNVTIDYKPLWLNFETSFAVRPGQSFSSGAPATDQDGDALRYSIIQYPTQGEVSIGETSGTFVYSSNNDGAGDDSFVVAVTDGYVTVQKTINVHVETYIAVDDIYERNFDTTSTAIHFESQLNAVDEDGDSLSWSVVSQPSLGTLSLNPSTGAYSYDAASGVTGDDHFILQVSDGVHPIQKGYTVHLYSIEDAGTSLVNITTTGHSFSDRILTNAHNTAVSYDVKTQGEFGGVTIDSESGEYTYTPLANTRGQDSFLINVSHTYGSYELKIFVYQNSLPNDSLVETNIVVPEDGSHSGSVACSDLDSGDVLSYSLKSNPMKGNVEINASTGTYTYMALPGLAGDDVFSIKVSDGFNEITIFINVHIESLPQTETDIYRTTSQNVQIEGLFTASDKDGDDLSYSLNSGASNGVSQVNSDGSYAYTPNAGFYGNDSFVATVTDGLNSVDVTIHVHVNRKPIPVNDLISVIANGTPIAGSVSVTDPDGDTLTYSINSQPVQGVATVDSLDGKFSYVPNEGAAGDDSFIIKAMDGVDYVLITVNVHNETEIIIDESNTNLTAIQGKNLNGVVAASDADGDVLSYRVVAAPNKGVLDLNSHTGAWSYDCNANVEGEDSFEIGVTDGTNEKTITYHLTINVPPKVLDSSDLSFITNQGVPYIGSIQGSDEDHDVLSYCVISQGQKGSVEIDSSTGQYTYTPDAESAGDDQFVLGISDGFFTTQVVVSAHIETEPIVHNSIQSYTVQEGGLIHGTVSSTDDDGDVLSYSISTQPTKGTITVDANGTWSFLANIGAGSDFFVIAVTDGTYKKYVTIHVFIDTLPTFETESMIVYVPDRGTVTDKVSAVDLDGDTLTYSVANQPIYGSVTLNTSTGNFTYSNNVKTNSPDSFKIKVTDSHGNEDFITVYVRINHAPTVEPLTLSVHQGETVEGQLVAIDIEGDPLTYSIFSQGTKGVANVDSRSGKIIYIANKGASGTDLIELTVSDGVDYVTITVTVKIQANLLPDVSDANFTMKQGDTLNATIGASDPDGDTLSFEVSKNPENGTVAMDASTGSFVYSPNHDFSGVDSFVVLVSDGIDVKEATINIEVIKNEAPKPKTGQQNYSVAQGNSLSGVVEVDDMEGDNLSYSVSVNPRYGSVQIDQKTGAFNYKADPFAAGSTDSFVVEVSDGFNVSRVMVQVGIDSTAMNIGFIVGGIVCYTGAVVAAVLIIGKLRKKGM